MLSSTYSQDVTPDQQVPPEVKPKFVAVVNQYAPIAPAEDGIACQMDAGDEPMEKYQATKKYLEHGLQEATQQQDDILIKAFEERLTNQKIPILFQNIKDATFLNQELLEMNSM